MTRLIDKFKGSTTRQVEEPPFSKEDTVKAFRVSPTDIFDIAAIVTDGRPLRALRIVCRCGATEVVRAATMQNSSPSDQAAKQDRQAARKFKEIGWKVGARPADHRCPKCLEREAPPPQAKQPPAKKEKPMASNVTPLPTTPAPKPMSREDRRIIFEKLNEVYVDENTGYADDWTDKAVAAHLGVPIAWVALIRDENFGPVASNAKIDEQLTEAKKLSAELKTTAAALLSKADFIDRRLDDIQKRVRP